MSQASVVASSPAVSLRVVPPWFSCGWKAGGSGAAWVHVAGDLDLATSPKLRQTLHDAQLFASLVVLDLREVTFIESAGVHVILDAAARVRRGAGRLILVRGPAQVDHALMLTGASNQVLTLDLDSSEPPAQALLRLASREKGEDGGSIAVGEIDREHLLDRWRTSASSCPLLPRSW
jgi:stage II sporulation protein AA (anti-sigma F factor antagonist)